MRRVEPQRHLPLVGRALEIAAVRVDARQHVVRIGDVRMPIESAQRDTHGDVELAGATQRVRERHEDEARRIAREVIAQAANLVSHRRTPSSSARRRTTAVEHLAHARHGGRDRRLR